MLSLNYVDHTKIVTTVTAGFAQEGQIKRIWIYMSKYHKQL